MSRQGLFRRACGQTARLAPPLAWVLAVAAGFGSTSLNIFFTTEAMAQGGLPPALPAVAAPAFPMPYSGPVATPVFTATPSVVSSVPMAPGSVMVAGAPLVPSYPADVQIVRFQGPAGVIVEVLSPNPEPAPPGDGQGLITVGMKVGVPYRLRVSNMPRRFLRAASSTAELRPATTASMTRTSMRS